jgi:hypothetical protein
MIAFTSCDGSGRELGDRRCAQAITMDHGATIGRGVHLADIGLLRTDPLRTLPGKNGEVSADAAAGAGGFEGDFNCRR